MVFESFRAAALGFSPAAPTAAAPGTLVNYNQGVVGADTWRGFSLSRTAAGYSGTSSLQFNAAGAYVITPNIISATGTITLSFRYRNIVAQNSTFVVEYSPAGIAPGYPGGGANPASSTWTTLGTASMVTGDGTGYIATPFTTTFTPGSTGYYIRIRKSVGGSAMNIDDLSWSSSVAAENTQVVLPTQTAPGATTCTTIAMPLNGVYTFTDNGGLSDTYSGAQNHTVTFTPFPGQRIQMKFASPVPANVTSASSYNVAATPTGSISISNTDNTLTNYTTNSAPAALYTSTAAGCTGVGTVQFTTTGNTGTGFVITVTSIDPASCSNVTGLGVTTSSIKYDEIPLTWTGLTGCTAPSGGYDYYVSDTDMPSPPTGALTPSATTSLQAGNVSSGTSTGTTVTGLAGNTLYYIWVRSNCGSTFGTWVKIAAGSVRTVCAPVAVMPPYTVDFEGSLSIPTCTSTNSISYGVGTASGNNYFFNAATGTWFFTSPLTLTPGLIYRLSYKYSNSLGSATTAQAFYGISEYGVSPSVTTTPLSTVTTISSTYNTSRSYFSPTVAGPYYIGIKIQSIAGGALKIDDIVLETVPCWPAAKPTISGPANPCPSINVTYTATAVGGATSNTPDSYTWTVPPGWAIVGPSTGSSIVVTTSVLTGSITCAGNFNSPICDSSDPAPYAVSAAPIPGQPSVITGASSICGALTSQTYSVINVAGVTYNWVFPSGWTITAGAGTNSVTVTPTATSGTITVTPSNVGLCLGTPRTLNVIVGVVSNPGCDTATPITTTATDMFRCGVRNFWYSFSPACSGPSPTGDYKITLAGTGGDIDLYVYSSCAGALGGTLLGSSTSASANESVTLTFSTPGPYYIRVFEYVATAGAGGNFTLSMASLELPTLGAISGFSSVSCAATTITPYSVTPVAGALSYNWTVPAGWTILGAPDGATITIRTNGSSAGTISVTPVGSCGIGIPATKVVTVGQITPGAIAGSANLCTLANTTYSVGSVTGATSYNWTLPPGWSIISGSGTTSITVAPNTNSGTVSVTATGACGTSPASTFTVSSALPVTTTGASVCPGTAGTVSATLTSLNNFQMPNISGASPTYVRASNTSTTAYISSGTTVGYSTQFITITTPGSYTFEGCDATNRDTFLAIYTGSFNPAAPATNFLAQNDDGNPNVSGTCALDPYLTVTLAAGTYVLVYSPYSTFVTTLTDISINATPAVQLGAIEWYDAVTGGTLIGTGASINPVGFGTYTTINTAGAHLFYATNTANSACRTPVTFTVKTPPTVTITNATATVCSIAVTPVTVTGNADTYTWTSDVSNTLYSNSTGTTAYVPGTNTTVVYVKTGATVNITVTGTNTTTTCTATSTLVLNVSAGGKTWNGGPGWIPPGAPTETDNVVINANYAAGSLSACTCTINAGTVSFAAGQTMTVVGDINNVGGTLTFADDASLLQKNTPAVGTNPNVGSISYQRTTSMRKFDYTYWSTPVEGQIIGLFSPLTLSDKYIWFDSTAGIYRWETVVVPGLTVMDVARGYGIRGPQDYSDSSLTPWTGTFIGKPNNGEYSRTIVKNGAFDMNFVGNPYPSAISATAFISQNTAAFGATPGTTLYFWTHYTQFNLANYVASDFVTYNYSGGTGVPGPALGASQANDYIASGQGFMVKAVIPGTTTVKFENRMRVPANNTNFFRSNAVNNQVDDELTTTVNAIHNLERNRVWLNFTNSEGNYKQILVGYIQNATDDYDNGFDGDFLDIGNPLGFYSLLNDKKMTIQGKALPFSTADSVPLGYRTDVAGTYEISLSDMDGLFEGQDVYLEDTLLNVVHALKNGSYSFVSEPGSYDGRFVLRYTGDPLAVDLPDFNENTVVVAKKDSTIQIQSSNVMMKTVQLFDIRGRLILEKNGINGTTLTMSNLNFANQVLVVNVVSVDGKIVTKKIVF